MPQHCPVSNHINRHITPPPRTDACDLFYSRLIALTEFIFKCPQICITLSWADGKVDWSCFRRLYQLHMRVLCSNSFMCWVSVPQIRHLDCDCSAFAIKPHKLTNSFIIRPCSFYQMSFLLSKKHEKWNVERYCFTIQFIQENTVSTYIHVP